jgi:diguanylate cyclase (GGDEF)-like protein
MLLRLLPFAAAIAVGLAGFAGLAMWQLRRLGFQLAQSEQHVYAGGDEALVEIGRRLPEALPVIGRLGSDEFACVISGAAADEMAALRTADALRQAIARPMWMKQLVQVSVSIGVALAPRDGFTRDELTRRADHALRSAKRRGRIALL